MLRDLPQGDRISSQSQTIFAGLNHTAAAGDGEFFAMENLSGELFPLLSSRRARSREQQLRQANGLYAKEKLAWVEGENFYYDGEYIGPVSDGPKTFASLGYFLLIFPDKKYFLTNWSSGNLYDRFGDLEASYSGSAGGIRFHDGEYAGAAAAANSISTSGAAFPFRVGDAISISGCIKQPENNKTPIIQEISADGKTLRFYANIFVLPQDADSYTEPGQILLKRSVPDMDCFCENENRLWGLKGKEIFSCKLGDPFNWNVFAGLSTDSYSVATGTDGDFSAAVSHLGYPVFFKPDAIHKIYGSKPSNFQVIHSANMGIAADSGKSPAIVGNTLYYLSESGVVAYQGGIPSLIDQALGGQFHAGIGGTDGKHYYISMVDEKEKRRLFVYDPGRNFWHEEDDPGIQAMANLGPRLYFLTEDSIWLARGADYSGVEWYAETGDFTDAHFGKKIVGPYLYLRYMLAPDAEMEVFISYEGGAWQSLGRIRGEGKKQSRRLASIPARCDHYRLRFEGSGQMQIYSLSRDRAAGSAV